MAIDSRNKRASAGHLPWMAVAPTPDGGIDSEADRRQVGGLYSGITGAPAPPAPAIGVRRRGGAVWLMFLAEDE